MIALLCAVVAQLDRASAFEAEAAWQNWWRFVGCHEHSHEDAVQREIAGQLQRAGLTIRGGLKESGLFDVVAGMHRSGQSWESIGQAIGWSPVNARECFILEGGTL